MAASSKKTKQQQKNYEQKIPVIIDMETGDPDDLLTLLFAACHPKVDLRAVTLTPGSEQQVQLVRHVLVTLYNDSTQSKRAKKTMEQRTLVRLGCQDWPKNQKKKGCVNLKFYETFLHPPSREREHVEELSCPGKGKRKKNGKNRATSSHIVAASSRHIDDTVYPAAELIRDVSLELRGKITILTGGPLHNLGAALRLGNGISFERWVGQGGFCGLGVVPEGVPSLPKFAGLTHTQTWNFGGSREATLLALETQDIARRVLVGKNVCHRCLYDTEFASRLAARCERSKREDGLDDKSHTSALRWIQKAVSSRYHQEGAIGDGTGGECTIKRRSAKALHDPLALATMLDESTCSLRRVEVSQLKEGGSILWGSQLTEKDSRTFAAVDFDHNRFIDTLLWE